MKRKLLFLFLISLTFGVGGLINVNAEELTPTKEWCFGFEEETGTITNYKSYSWDSCNWDVVIPETIKGVEVKRIGNKAFMGDGIESVVIPDTVTSIGNLAFASNDFREEVVIPDTVTKIGYGVFNDNEFIALTDYGYLYARSDANNDGIAEIDKTKLIGVAHSEWDGYSYITVPEQVKTIGSKAFYGLVGLNPSTYEDEEILIYLHEGLETIEEKAFYGATISYVYVPASLKTADFTIDSEQIPYYGQSVLYQGWFKEWIEDGMEHYTEYYFKSGEDALIHNVVYYEPDAFIADIYSVNYNKAKIELWTDGTIDEIQVFKYNSTNKKYELYTTTTNTDYVNLTKGLKTGKTYYFKVRAVVTTPDGETYYSRLSEGLGVKPKLKTPTGVKATKYKSGVAKVKWNKVDGASGYTLYKYNSKTKKYVAVKSVKGTSTTTSYGLKKGKGTYYKVKAYRIVDGKRVYSAISKNDYVRV